MIDTGKNLDKEKEWEKMKKFLKDNPSWIKKRKEYEETRREKIESEKKRIAKLDSKDRKAALEKLKKTINANDVNFFKVVPALFNRKTVVLVWGDAIGAKDFAEEMAKVLRNLGYNTAQYNGKTQKSIILGKLIELRQVNSSAGLVIAAHGGSRWLDNFKGNSILTDVRYRPMDGWTLAILPGCHSNDWVGSAAPKAMAEGGLIIRNRGYEAIKWGVGGYSYEKLVKGWHAHAGKGVSTLNKEMKKIAKRYARFIRCTNSAGDSYFEFVIPKRWLLELAGWVRVNIYGIFK